jgi:guanylate kinase
MLIVNSQPTDRRPIIISGPSGVGKGTLYKILMERHPDSFATSISHTTRDPRPGEVRDHDYYYVPMQEFEGLIAENGFVEHAKFGGNRYGTSKKMIEEMGKKGRVVVLDIEMEVS